MNQTIAKYLGNALLSSADMQLYSVDDLKPTKIWLLYFSASFCKPCKKFTPILQHLYKHLNASFEIVLIPKDFTQAEFLSYFQGMNWLSVPFEDQKRIDWLTQLFSIESIPALVILNQDGQIVNSNAYQAILSDPQGQFFPWPEYSMMGQQ